MQHLFSPFRLLIVAVLALLITNAPVLAQVADSTAAAATPGAQIFSFFTLALGAGGVALTAIAKKVLGKLDGTTERVDGKLVAFFKPIQPIVAGVVALAVPFIQKLTGHTVDPNVLIGAPVMTLGSISVWEGLKALGKRLGF